MTLISSASMLLRMEEHNVRRAPRPLEQGVHYESFGFMMPEMLRCIFNGQRDRRRKKKG